MLARLNYSHSHDVHLYDSVNVSVRLHVRMRCVMNNVHYVLGISDLPCSLRRSKAVLLVQARSRQSPATSTTKVWSERGVGRTCGWSEA